MNATPLLAQSLAEYSEAVATSSVRTVWMEFMSWVVGGIGFGYLAREGVVRLPALLTVLVPAQFLRTVEVHGEHEQMPSAARVGISS